MSIQKVFHENDRISSKIKCTIFGVTAKQDANGIGNNAQVYDIHV